MCVTFFLGIRNSWEFIYFYALVVADGKTCRSLKCFCKCMRRMQNERIYIYYIYMNQKKSNIIEL